MRGPSQPRAARGGRRGGLAAQHDGIVLGTSCGVVRGGVVRCGVVRDGGAVGGDEVPVEGGDAVRGDAAGVGDAVDEGLDGVLQVGEGGELEGVWGAWLVAGRVGGGEGREGLLGL